MISKEDLIKYQIAYSKGEPLISDEEYDVLLEEYLNTNGEDKRPFLRQKQTDSINKVVGTLSKVYGVETAMRSEQKTYKDWINKISKIESLNRCEVIAQPKFDGCSVALDCQTNQFFTRGDYDNGISVNVSELFQDKTISLDNKDIKSIKFEAILSHEDFKSINDLSEIKYHKPIDALNAIITSRNIKLSKFITLVPLRCFVSSGIEYIPESLINMSLTTQPSNYESIQNFIDDKLEDGATVNINNRTYSIDGVVVSLTSTKNDKHSSIPVLNNNEIAIKILNDVKETKLVDVIFQYGKSGRITPVALVEPTLFCNGTRTVDHITLSTFERVASMNLRKGDTVRLMYNIVPYFMGTNNDGNGPYIKIPDECPYCHHKLDLTILKLVRCTNPNCEGYKRGSITRYCQKMKMFGLSNKTVDKLYDSGLVQNISDLYLLTTESIIRNSVTGGTKSAENIINTIKQSSKNVKLSNWLGAFPMSDISNKTWENYINMISVNKTNLSNNIIELIKTKPILDLINYLFPNNWNTEGNITQDKMIDGLLKNETNLKYIVHYIEFEQPTPNRDVTSNGIRVTLTGTRDKSVMDYLINKGYEINDYSPTKTKYLIIPNESYDNKKVRSAPANNIQILTISEVFDKL